MPIDTQALFDEKDYTGTYPYVADGVIGPYTRKPGPPRLLGTRPGREVQAEALCGEEPAPLPGLLLRLPKLHDSRLGTGSSEDGQYQRRNVFPRHSGPLRRR